MANEDKKDFNAMLQEDKGMPKWQTITDEKAIARYGGSRMYFAPPLDYDAVMKRIPAGKLTTTGEIRAYFARHNDADFTEPITAGAFISIAAWASHQRDHDKTPYWRTLKAKGEINPKYPGGISAQCALLEAEGHTIIVRGRKNLRYYVENYEAALYDLEEGDASTSD
ncbi:MAG: MGMT family protein [Peptococcaceae bacterium]|nr:MGMT family protein [Peptococcaceae bacterium]